MAGTGVTWSWLQTRRALANTEAAQRDRALAQVEALLTAEPESVPFIIETLEPFRDVINARLRELNERRDLPEKQRMRVSLALLPVDEGQVSFLASELLRGQPDEVLVIRNALQPYKSVFEEKLWTLLEDARGKPGERLRAACALAGYASDSARWAKVQKDVAGILVMENAILLGKWMESLRPVRRQLVFPLVEIFQDRKRPESDRTLATSALSDYAQDMPEVLADVIMDADPRQFKVLLPNLQAHREGSIDCLRKNLARTLRPEWKETASQGSWKTPDGVFVSKIEKAYGFITEHFALCQTMPLGEFVAATEGLRGAGYRPTRVRPYAVGKAMQVAAVWARDGRDWQMVHNLTAEEIRRHDASMQEKGYSPVDVAGYVSPDTGRSGILFSAVWTKSDNAKGRYGIEVGLSQSQMRDSLESLKKEGDVPLTLNTVLGLDGQLLFSAVWKSNEGGSDPIEPLIGDELSYERQLGVGLQMDVSLARAPNDPNPKGSLSEALSRAEDVLRGKPEDLGARLGRSKALLGLGKFEAALADLTFVIDKNPKDASPYHSRALAYARLGRFAEADKDLAEALRLIDPVKSGDYLVHAARINGLAAQASVAKNAGTAKRYAHRAIELLREAIAQGYDDYRQLQTDPDLEAIRSNPVWQELLPSPHMEREYVAVWHASKTLESQEIHGLDVAEGLERCRLLANQGYRPAAIAVAWFEEKALVLTASVWHRPVVQVALRTALAKRQAQATVALVHLGRPDLAWPLLRFSKDPTVRTELIHLWTPLEAHPRLLIKRLETEQDASTRRALILSLGQSTAEQWLGDERQALEGLLLRLFCDDPDPGLHSAAEWLMRRWGRGNELMRLSQELTSPAPTSKRRWYINRQGQTLAVIAGPVEFVRGSPTHEAGRWWNEALHVKRIGRTFAFSTKEVTVTQFERFLQVHPEFPRFTDARRYSPDPDGPVIRVSWYAAAAYCRWLSEQEGILEDQMCYPAIPEIKEGLVLPDDYLSRTGYRLPTDAEWEYACRAGTETSRFFGENEAMLPNYAWYLGNAGDRTHPGGMLEPNDFGLFDMLGNVVEWCQDPGVLFEPGARGWSREDNAFLSPVSNKTMRILRGGAYDDPPESLRAAKRNGHLPTYRFEYNGLRVARTLR